MADNSDIRIMFDLETGGTRIGKDAIIQIAAIAFNIKTFGVIETFERKVKFKVEVADRRALEVNSYDKQLWETDAIHPQLAMSNTLSFLRKYAQSWVSAKGKTYQAAELVGHNIIRFDWPFFEAWCKALGESWLPIHFAPLDTLQVAKTVEEVKGFRFDNLRLETLAAHYGVGEPQTHDALDDVLLNIQVLRSLLSDLKGES